MYIPAIFALLALVLIGWLLSVDKNKDFNKRGVGYFSKFGLSSIAAERAFSTFEGFILIFSLVFILGAFLFYF